MKHATSQLHIDSQGLATVVDMLCGKKYWVVARTKQKGQVGDLESIRGLWKAWDPSSNGGDRFDLEAVLLSPGSLLYGILFIY